MYCGLGEKINTSETPHGMRRSWTHFVSACVVGKNLNTSNLSPMADYAITRGGIRGLGSPLYICVCSIFYLQIAWKVTMTWQGKLLDCLDPKVPQYTYQEWNEFIRCENRLVSSINTWYNLLTFQVSVHFFGNIILTEIKQDIYHQMVVNQHRGTYGVGISLV